MGILRLKNLRLASSAAAAAFVEKQKLWIVVTEKQDQKIDLQYSVRIRNAHVYIYIPSLVILHPM